MTSKQVLFQASLHNKKICSHITTIKEKSKGTNYNTHVKNASTLAQQKNDKNQTIKPLMK